MSDMEKILGALTTGLVYVTDCENDPAFKPGVVRAQAKRIKEAIEIAERIKEQGKPSWDDAPAWAQFLTLNEMGHWVWHQVWPERAGSVWVSGGMERHAGYHSAIDWKDSFEARP